VGADQPRPVGLFRNPLEIVQDDVQYQLLSILIGTPL
jgi:hypothetical protein